MRTLVQRLATVAAFAATLTALTATNAQAQTYYNTLAAFNAAATTVTIYTFEGIAPASSAVQNPDVLVTPAPGRITFTASEAASGSGIFAYDSNYFPTDFHLSDGSDSVSVGNPVISDSISTISLDGLYTAFAIEYGMFGNQTALHTFTLFNGDTQVGTLSSVNLVGGNNFFGATSATPFNRIRVNTARTLVFGRVLFDNARTGSPFIAVAVPEPGTFALIGIGASLLGVVVRRRK